MLIAIEKEKTNIAEFIIYMWQVEDSIRAFNFDIDQIDRHIISKYDQPDHVTSKIKKWYENLMEGMRSEGIEKTGHLKMLKNKIQELTKLHNQLLQQTSDSEYQNLYKQAFANIVEYQNILKNQVCSEIDICLQALYSIFLLRLKKKEISPETSVAIETFSKLIAYLSKKYHSNQKAI
jgi:hypothetical protein